MGYRLINYCILYFILNKYVPDIDFRFVGYCDNNIKEFINRIELWIFNQYILGTSTDWPTNLLI